MPRNTPANGIENSKVIHSKKNNGKRHISAETAPRLPELPQAFINSQTLFEHAQHQINLLVGRNASLQEELIKLGHKEAQARHLAYHDGLTGLPNRNLLQDRFHQALSQAERHHKPLALLVLDLDDFKRVNDKLGHASGDKLLQAVAQRLTKGIRGADTACRYGGDEFVIMLQEIDNPNIAAALVEEIGNRLSEPYLVDDHKIHMTVSIGVAIYPGDGQTFADLIKQADINMYLTKDTGHGTSITGQTKEDISESAWRNPPALMNADSIRERDLFIQDELAHGQEQKKKRQRI